MSGGIAYVLDERGEFPSRVNRQMVGTGKLEAPEEIAEVRALIERHPAYTRSPRARHVLDNWEKLVPHFVQVMPNDYQRMLACISAPTGRA